MEKQLTNIHEAPWEERIDARGGTWRALHLGGEHLGVRVEELQPSETSSVHHFHSMEEEHVLILEGTATLFLGQDEIAIKSGDHVWFQAGSEVPHHIENRSGTEMKYLVFGERCAGDVVFYPEHRVMTVKGLGWKQMTYRERLLSEKGNDLAGDG